MRRRVSGRRPPRRVSCRAKDNYGFIVSQEQLRLAGPGGEPDGVVVLSGASFTNEKVVMATSGAITTCGTGAGNLTCSGTPKAAIYHLVGTATANVQFLSPGFNLSNGAATLPFVPSSTSQVVQLSAGGTFDVSLGGTVSGLSNTTPDGVYTGTFAVTADYQ